MAMARPFSDPVMVAHRLEPEEFICILTSQAEPRCPASACADITTSPSRAGPRFDPSPRSANN